MGEEVWNMQFLSPEEYDEIINASLAKINRIASEYKRPADRMPGDPLLGVDELNARFEQLGLPYNDLAYQRYLQSRQLLRKQKLNENLNTFGYIAPTALDFIGSAYNGFRYDKTASDLSADYGYGRSQALGVGYTTQNIADARQVMKEEHSGNVTNTLNTMGKGAALGSVLGPLGAATGAAVGGVLGLFGGGSRHAQARRELALQQLQAIRTNNYNRSLAMTAGMQLDFVKKYGNQESLVLFAAGGKDMKNGFRKWLAPVDDFVNAVIKPEEPIIHPDGTGHIVKGGVPNKDSVGVRLKSKDAVATNDYIDRQTGVTFAQEAMPYIQLLNAIKTLINKNKGSNNQIAKNVAKKTLDETKNLLLAITDRQHLARINGDLPPEGVAHAANGIDNWGNVVQTLAGIGTALGGYFLAKNSKVHRPDIRVANPYESRALADLYSLRPDNLSIIRGLRDAEARGRYQIASAGGLGAGQRALANVALTANTLNSIANALAQSQDRFNALRSLAATTALNTGNATAQRNMAALQYNDAAYQQAASARQNVMRDYLAQIPGMLGQYYKNWYTQQMGNNMLNLYQQGNGLELMKYMNDSQRQKILNEMGYA